MSKVSPKKYGKRCHWYYSDGTPILQDNGTRGCERPGCRFAHPNDPEWTYATPTYPVGRRDSSTRDFEYGRDRAYERDVSKPMTIRRPISPLSTSIPRAPSSSKVLERQASSPVSRKDSMDSIRSRKELGERITSPTRDRDRERSRAGSSSVSGDVGKEKRGEASLDRGRIDDRKENVTRRPEESKERAGSTTSTTSRAGPSSESMPPPPLKAAPPLPRSDSVKKDPQVSTQVSKADKLDSWVTRVKEMANAVTARHEYVKLEREIAQLRSLMNGRRNIETSKETQSRLERQLDEAESRFSMKKEELNAAVFRLVDSQFWPVPPRMPSDGSDQSEDKFQELRIAVYTLKEQVKDLSESAQKQTHHDTSALSKNGQTNATLPPSSTNVQQADMMEVDEPRPAKRRRLSPQEGAASAEHGTPSAKPDPALQRDLEALSDRVQNLEEKLSDIENDMVQFDNDLATNLDEQITEKLDRINLPPAEQGQTLVDTGQVSDVTGALQQLQIEFDQAGKEIEEVASEVGSIIKHVSIVDDDLARIKAENELLKQKIGALEEKQKETDEMMKTYKAELSALNAAFTAYLARPPDPIPPPVLPDIETLMEALRQPIIASVREEISPMLSALRTEVERILDAHMRQISSALFTKLARLLKTERYIQEYLDRELRNQADAQSDSTLLAASDVNGAPATSTDEMPQSTGSTDAHSKIANGNMPGSPRINGVSPSQQTKHATELAAPS